MLVTQRLMLRPWWDDDFERMAAINADPAVMRWFGSAPLARAQSDAWLARTIARTMRDGFGPWAVEAPRVAQLVGAVGLRQVDAAMPFAPAVEVLWRIGSAWQGRGYATEAAAAAIADAFETRGFAEVVAYTAATNLASRRVMEKLGMVHDAAADFDHPGLARGHALRRHVLYRLGRPVQPTAVADSGWRLGASFADGGTVPDR